MNQHYLDLGREEAARDQGMERAEHSGKDLLIMARAIAVELGRANRFVNSDMVNREMYERHQVLTLGNATGSLFKTPDWKPTNLTAKSAKPGARARMIRVWEYKHYART